MDIPVDWPAAAKYPLGAQAARNKSGKRWVFVWNRWKPLEATARQCVICNDDYFTIHGSKGAKFTCGRPACNSAHTTRLNQAKIGSLNPYWKGGVTHDNMRYRRRQRERWPEKEHARRTVGNAIRSGLLVPKPCEVCSNPRVHGHHDDYSKPLAVAWLCIEHHKERHGGRAVGKHEGHLAT